MALLLCCVRRGWVCVLVVWISSFGKLKLGFWVVFGCILRGLFACCFVVVYFGIWKIEFCVDFGIDVLAVPSGGREAQSVLDCYGSSGRMVLSIV